MIGIILWVIVLFIIVICACPGFLTFFFCVALPVGIVVFVLATWIQNKLNK